ERAVFVENVRRVVNGMAVGIIRAELQSAAETLCDGELQRMEIRRSRRFDHRVWTETRILSVRNERHRLEAVLKRGIRLQNGKRNRPAVRHSRAKQFRADRTYICDRESVIFSDLALDGDVPLLTVRRAKMRVGQYEREAASGRAIRVLKTGKEQYRRKPVAQESSAESERVQRARPYHIQVHAYIVETEIEKRSRHKQHSSLRIESSESADIRISSVEYKRNEVRKHIARLTGDDACNSIVIDSVSQSENRLAVARR